MLKKPDSAEQTAAKSTATVQPQTKASQPPFSIVHPQRKERWLNMAVYGEYGVGKTTFAATACDSDWMRDVLYVDAESGDLTLQDRPTIDVIRISNYTQLARIVEFLRLHCAARDAGDEERIRELDAKVRGEASEKAPKYKTVVIDSLTEIFKYCMYNLTGIKLDKYVLDMEPEQPGFGEWGKSTEMIRLLVRSLRDLPMHVIFVLSEKSVDDKAKRASIQLNLPKALAAELPGFLDLVGYLDIAAIGGDKNNPVMARRLYIQPGMGFLAKNRFTGVKEQYIEDPTMPKIAKLIRSAQQS